MLDKEALFISICIMYDIIIGLIEMMDELEWIMKEMEKLNVKWN